ncbi:Glycoside hydrolase family 16 protein [Mycena chlorophos]|uniref:Glycoside hydrolase family 16 protein n=1 Tax=Mycena chlorophos TaxID=658473 RepID=A0A8H6WKX3_MYCCL|nr:Glycoside hydrolase family 16 protein [Mycena chlorophos]
MLTVFFLASLLSPALAGTYSRSQNIVGKGFYDAFNFEAIPDPTAGRVDYVDKATAMANNLTYASDDTFILRADHKTVISDSSSVGRKSVRIRSNKAYTTHVAIFNVKHMPQGCGTWPAIWETNESNWPAGGEVDIVEGVNNQGTDQITLHTSPGCTMPASRKQTGTVVSTDCNTAVNGNQGCAVKAAAASSFGPTFNSKGGGWYAIERTESFIKVWFWGRQASDVPEGVRTGGTTVDTGNWGTPTADFPNTDCNISKFFDANNIIINLTFCGDWAGQASIYASSGCPSTCVNYVDQNPSAFTNAFFEFKSISIYT